MFKTLQGLNALYPEKYVYVIVSKTCPNCATRKNAMLQLLKNNGKKNKQLFTSNFPSPVFQQQLDYSETFIVKFCATFPVLFHSRLKL